MAIADHHKPHNSDELWSFVLSGNQELLRRRRRLRRIFTLRTTVTKTASDLTALVLLRPLAPLPDHCFRPGVGFGSIQLTGYTSLTYEPGKQVKSAVKIKNTSKSYVAFKLTSSSLRLKHSSSSSCNMEFQTTAPKSCYMRPPGGILEPGETLYHFIFKFVEHPENNEKPVDQKSKVKFKIMSLKVKEGVDYVPELLGHHASSALCPHLQHINFLADDFMFTAYMNRAFLAIMWFEEQKDKVTIERILRVVFLDPERPSPALEKLKRQLAEAEAT
ncbi:hypothetical protein HAX54_049576 [Datura stramonium]|uniref:MSP domain-containing protein n=1 Tax=Datura stramonium TaxID=4076 RepID=A0ABS8SVM0_DATST|nr:hypothetical protein [Datura stramonium]